MLRVEPLHRINMKEIRSHQWILSYNSPTPPPRKIRIMSEDIVDEENGIALQRENKKSTVGAFFNKLINRKSGSKEQRKNSIKIDRKEKRKSVMVTAVPQPTQNKRWSISIGPLKISPITEELVAV